MLEQVHDLAFLRFKAHCHKTKNLFIFGPWVDIPALQCSEALTQYTQQLAEARGEEDARMSCVKRLYLSAREIMRSLTSSVEAAPVIGPAADGNMDVVRSIYEDSATAACAVEAIALQNVAVGAVTEVTIISSVLSSGAAASVELAPVDHYILCL